MIRFVAVVIGWGFASCLVAAEPAPSSWKHEELRRWPAAEAHQGVAVDAEFFYAISNAAIGKYRKDTGQRVGGWQGEKGGPIVHLNSGIVASDGTLYCAHSNYPHVPATGSLEVFNAATMEQRPGHSFGIMPGSLTWAYLQRNGNWLACFAHYEKDRARTGRGPEFTEVVELNAQFQRLRGWALPQAVLDQFGGNSSSGGSIGPDGNLFITGHDAPTLFVLKQPLGGSTLQLIETIPMSAHGQAIAFDPTDGNVLYSISRKTKEVIVSRLTKK